MSDSPYGGKSYDCFIRDAKRSKLTTEQHEALALLVVNTRVSVWCAVLDYLPTIVVVADSVRSSMRAKEAAALENEWSSLLAIARKRSSAKCGDAQFSTLCRAMAQALSIKRVFQVARLFIADFTASDGQSSEHAAQAELLTQLLQRHDAARNRFASANVLLVISMARKMRGWLRGLSLDDLIQEGNIGLLRAIETFDPSMGFKFSTYAMWWIRHMASRAEADQGRLVRVPQHMHDRAWKIQNVAKRYHRDHGEWPTSEQIAEIARMTVKHVEDAYEALGPSLLSSSEQIVSTDASAFDDAVDGDGSASVGDMTIADVDMEEDACLDQRSAALKSAIVELLPKRSREIMFRYAGIGGRPETLEEIGRSMGLTRERVRQIRESSIPVVRRRLNGRGVGAA